MSTTLDALLDEQVNEGKIVLTIDEPTRTLNYPSELILGVQGDYCAERIYFQSPKILHDDIDLTSPNIEIYVNYEDAYSEPHIEQCSKPEEQADGTVMFSWLISDKVAEYKGTVKFNVCVKNIVNDEIQNEWHTTKFSGKVLDAVDVDEKTPETITSDSKTYQSLENQVQSYEQTLAGYTAQYNEWTDELQTYDEFILEKIRANDGIMLLNDVDSNNNIIDFQTDPVNILGDDYLANITEPGVYVFFALHSCYLLTVGVNQYNGELYQSIYYTDGENSEPTYLLRTSENNGETWPEFTAKALAYKDVVDPLITNVSALNNKVNAIYLDSSIDLDTVTTPGLYIYNRTIVDVSDNGQYIMQTRLRINSSYSSGMTSFDCPVNSRMLYTYNNQWTEWHEDRLVFKSQNKYYEHRVHISGKGSGNSSEYLFTLITKSATAFTTVSSLATELIKRGAIDHISYIPATGMHKTSVDNPGYHVFGLYAVSEGNFLDVCFYSSDPDEEDGGYFMDFSDVDDDNYEIRDSVYEIR